MANLLNPKGWRARRHRTLLVGTIMETKERTNPKELTQGSKAENQCKELRENGALFEAKQRQALAKVGTREVFKNTTQHRYPWQPLCNPIWHLVAKHLDERLLSHILP
jgi:hypothetical protein